MSKPSRFDPKYAIRNAARRGAARDNPGKEKTIPGLADRVERLEIVLGLRPEPPGGPKRAPGAAQ